MKLTGPLAIVGALVVLLIIVFGGEWFFSEEPPAAAPAASYIVADNGMATLAVPTDSGVTMRSLSPWQVIAFDALERTYLGGFEITGADTAFATPVEFEMNLSAVPVGVPMVFKEVSGITVLVDDVTYVMSNGVIERIRAKLDAPGRIYVLQQHVFYGEPSILSVNVDQIDETVIGNELQSAYQIALRDGIGVYGVIAGQEYGYSIDPASVTASVDVRTSGSAVMPPSASGIARLDGAVGTRIAVPIESGLACQSTEIVPTEIVLTVSFESERYVRTVNDWVRQYAQPAGWNLVENSADEHSFTFISMQSPRCI